MSNKAEKNKKWREAKKKFRLANMHIQMARELGMNPMKLAGLANHKQEPWKAPLPVFIERIAKSALNTTLHLPLANHNLLPGPDKLSNLSERSYTASRYAERLKQ